MKILQFLLAAVLLVTSSWGQNSQIEKQVERARAAAETTALRQQAAIATAREKTAASVAKQTAVTSKQKDAARALRPSLVSTSWSVAGFNDNAFSGTFAANFEPPDCPQVAAPALSQMIASASQRTGVDPDLVREVARQESAFRPCSVSYKGAEGLMQLMPSTQAMFGVNDPMDPNQSLLGGAQLLRQLLMRYGGNVALALSAYNAGATTVDKAGGIPEIPETQDYVSTILGRLGPH